MWQKRKIKGIDCGRKMIDYKILIEIKQNDIRNAVIEQYIKCRKEKKMTQKDVANILGTKRPNITRFENGSYNPTLDFLVKVAESMGKELEIKLIDKKGVNHETTNICNENK